MAIRDRLTVYFRDPGVPQLEIVATRQGGVVSLSEPKRGEDFFALEELSSVNNVIRTLHVHKDTIRAIVRDVAPPEKKGKAK